MAQPVQRRRRLIVNEWLVRIPITFVVAAFWSAAASGQQPTGEERALPTAASLPENPEALLLSARTQTAIQSGDYRVAIDLIRQLGALPDGLVAAPASRTFYTVRGEARRLLGRLPEPGIQLYRQMFDAEVQARFEDARARADLAEIRNLFESYPLCSGWTQMGLELVARLLDYGRFSEALEVLEQMGATGPAGDESTRSMAVVGFGGLGAWAEAQRVLDALQIHARTPGREAASERVERLCHWLTRRESAGQTGAAALRPELSLPAPWVQQLVDPNNRESPREAELNAALADLRRFPLQEPIIADDALLVRLRGTLWALDALTLTPLWNAREKSSEPQMPEMSRGQGRAAGPAESLAPETRILLGSPLRHTLGVGFGLALTIEEQPSADEEEILLTRRTIRSFSDPLARNELVARRIDSGDVVWRAGDDAATPLYNVAFQDRPLAIGDALVVPIRRGDEIRLVTIDPNDGSLVRETPVVGPPTHFTRQGGRAQLEADETTLFVCTGNGVIAALERDSQKWKWATVYPNTLIQHMGRFWWRTENQVPELAFERPVLAGGLLIAAPIDSLELLALDRVTGREQWRLSRREYRHLIGSVRAGLVVAGSALVCLDPADPMGAPPRWRSVPLTLTGRPAIRDERIYAPTRDGLIMLDAATGKIIEDAGPGGAAAALVTGSRSADLIGANLLCGNDGVYAVAPGTVRKYPDLQAVRRRSAALGDPADQSRALLAQAWVDLSARDYHAAVARMEQLPDAPIWRDTRDRILTQSYLALARESPDRAARLEWLNRASRQASSPDSLAQLGFTIARALQEAGEFQAAAEKYAELILRGPPVLVFENGGEIGLRQSAWLAAASELRALLAGRDESARQTILAALIHQSEGAAPVALQHLRSALSPGSAQSALDARLTLMKVPPELAVHYLLFGDDAARPASERAALWLRRWEVHAALGDVEAARADRDYWQKTFANQAAANSGDAGEEMQERVEALRLSIRKQEQAVGAPYTEHVAPQWRIEQAELFFAPQSPLDFSGRQLLVRNWEERRIELVDVWKHQGALRVYEDGLTGESGRHAPPTPSPFAAPRHGGIVEEPARVAWSVLRYESLAVLPVGGGLLCVGLGPERNGGSRIWQAALPEWNGMLAELRDRAAVGPAGVCLLARRDRVEMLDWADGHTRWQRELPALQVERLAVVGDLVVLISDDGQLFLLRAADGREVSRWSADAALPRGFEVVAGKLLIWTDELLGAFDPLTLKSDWTIATETIIDLRAVVRADWVAFRTEKSLEWQVLDARTGKAAVAGGIGSWEHINALAWDGKRLLVSGRSGESGSDSAVPVKLAAFNSAGQRLWMHDGDLKVEMNESQLVTHPDYIPVLVSASTGSPDREMTKYGVELLRREDGERAAHFDLDNVIAREHLCDAMLLATPSRMIVQVRMNIVAFGNSALSPAP